MYRFQVLSTSSVLTPCPCYGIHSATLSPSLSLSHAHTHTHTHAHTHTLTLTHRAAVEKRLTGGEALISTATVGAVADTSLVTRTSVTALAPFLSSRLTVVDSPVNIEGSNPGSPGSARIAVEKASAPLSLSIPIANLSQPQYSLAAGNSTTPHVALMSIESMSVLPAIGQGLGGLGGPVSPTPPATATGGGGGGGGGVGQAAGGGRSIGTLAARVDVFAELHVSS